MSLYTGNMKLQQEKPHEIEIVHGNLVKQPDVDAAVNSAIAHLRLGSGVADAIHTAAGPKLEEYCKPFAPLAYGAYLVTPGFKLPNLWVIQSDNRDHGNSHDLCLIHAACWMGCWGGHLGGGPPN